MKSAVMLISLFFSLSAFADAPKVSCELMYNKTDAKGISVDFAPGESISVTKQGVTSSNKGFKLQANLDQVCAADGGPCADAYTLSVTISNGKSQSFLNAPVTSKSEGRVSTGLTVGKEDALANCDLNF